MIVNEVIPEVRKEVADVFLSALMNVNKEGYNSKLSMGLLFSVDMAMEAAQKTWDNSIYGDDWERALDASAAAAMAFSQIIQRLRMEDE